ncbi:MAG: hypothetical protein EXR79_04085 [Myxococcales bacterium]|nr:hypothetical protein [Myxococcales bacterium]
MREIVWTLVAFALQAAVSPLLGRLESQFFAPDIALLTALYVGSRSSLLRGVACGFAVGLFKDGLALAAPIGVYTEITVLAVLAGRVLEKRVDLRSAVPLMATAAGVTLAATALFLLLEAVFHRAFDAYLDVVQMALPLALVTMLVAPLYFALLDRLSRPIEGHARPTLLGRGR